MTVEWQANSIRKVAYKSKVAKSVIRDCGPAKHAETEFETDFKAINHDYRYEETAHNASRSVEIKHACQVIHKLPDYSSAHPTAEPRHTESKLIDTQS